MDIGEIIFKAKNAKAPIFALSFAWACTRTCMKQWRNRSKVIEIGSKSFVQDIQWKSMKFKGKSTKTGLFGGDSPLRTCFHSYFPLLLSRRFALPLEELGFVLTSISFLVAVAPRFEARKVSKGVRKANE